ncbi:LOW QUALITY PROTEIN: Gag protein, partial [Phytophthora palmivora]
MFPPLSGTGAPEMVAKALKRPKKYWESLTPTKKLRWASQPVVRPRIIAKRVGLPPRPNAGSRRAVRASTVAVPGNIVPQAGNIGPQAAEAAGEDAESASGVGNTVPRKVEETEKMNKSTTCVSSVSNEVPRGVKKTSTRAEVSLSTSRVDNKAPHSEAETPYFATY